MKVNLYRTLVCLLVFSVCLLRFQQTQARQVFPAPIQEHVTALPSTEAAVDAAPPSVVLSGNISYNGPWTLLLTFSEPVTGLTVGDLSVLNTTVSNLQTTDNIHYSMLLTPMSGSRKIDIYLPAGTVNNSSGDGNTVSNTISYYFDSQKPVVTAVDVPPGGAYQTLNVLNFDIRFSEVVHVTGMPVLPINIGGVTVNAEYSKGSGTNSLNFKYAVRSMDQDGDGIQSGTALNLNGGSIVNDAGIQAALILNNVGNTNGVFVNVNPTAVITTPVSQVNEPFFVTIIFSEAVTGFSSGAVTVTNGTASNLSTSDNIIYKMLITPVVDGAVTVVIPAGAAQNSKGAYNLPSTTLNCEYDATAPEITGVSVPVNGFYMAGSPLDFKIKFSEPVTVNPTPFPGRLRIIIGSSIVEAGYLGGSGTNELSFTYTVRPGDNDMDGIALGGALHLNGGEILDASGNKAGAALVNVPGTSGVFVNTMQPTVTLSTGAASLLNKPFTVTASFSEKITGLAATDFNCNNCSVSSLSTADNISYSMTVTPATDGAVSISLPAGAVVNIGNNANTASNTLSLMYDGTAPEVLMVAVPVNDYYKAGASLDFIVRFSEPVTVFPLDFPGYLNIVIGSSTVKAVYQRGVNDFREFLFSYTVQDGDIDMDGIAIQPQLVFNGGKILDDAGNEASGALTNIGNTDFVRVNTQRPSVVLTTTAMSPVKNAFTVTAVFSEAVTGLNAASFSAANCTLSALATSDNIAFNFTVTPITDGPVIIQLPADKAQNMAENGNRASNTLTLTADVTPPVITPGQYFTILQNSANGTEVGGIAVNETGLQNWTITSDPTNGGFSINSSGKILVGNTATLNNYVGQNIALLITVSDGNNTSAPTAVTVKVTGINKAPTLNPVPDAAVCIGSNIQQMQLTGASAGDPGQTYSITAAASQAWFDLLTVDANGVLKYQLKTNVQPGQALITVTIKDDGGTANGGVDQLQRSFKLTLNALPVISISSDKGTTVSKGQLVHLTASGASGYWWEDASGIISGKQSATLEIRPLANTTYKVAGKNAAGCSSHASLSIATIEDFKVDATNILTPNGDGKNDRWIVRNIDSYPDNEVKIFDRAGRLVYQRRNYHNEWDGTVNGQPLAEGVYYYFLTIGNSNKLYKGAITIIRDRY